LAFVTTHLNEQNETSMTMIESSVLAGSYDRGVPSGLWACFIEEGSMWENEDRQISTTIQENLNSLWPKARHSALKRCPAQLYLGHRPAPPLLHIVDINFEVRDLGEMRVLECVRRPDGERIQDGRWLSALLKNNMKVQHHLIQTRVRSTRCSISNVTKCNYDCIVHLSPRVDCCVRRAAHRPIRTLYQPDGSVLRQRVAMMLCYRALVPAPHRIVLQSVFTLRR
ncbi:unnamed protein product, partial [Trichogramma brassicae]